jgi:Domain of unknown function (DUF4232)
VQSRIVQYNEQQCEALLAWARQRHRASILIGSAVLLLVSCASSDGTSLTTGSPSTIIAIDASTTAAVDTSTTAVPVVTTPVTTSTVATPAETSAPATIAPCDMSALAVSIGFSDGAMGTRHTAIVFTNTGDVACTLDGHPGVSFVDIAGNQIGPSAERTPIPTPTIAVAPGEAAHATLISHNGGAFEGCVPVPATRMKVYPPDQTTAIILGFDVDVCTGTISEPQFTIDVVMAGDRE